MRRCIVTFCLLILAVVTNAQVEEPRRFKTAGAITGIGPTISDNTTYTVFYAAGDFSWSFSKPRKRDFVSLYFEPQFNFVRTERPLDIEFGANLGIRNYIKLGKDFYFYQMLGSGPHFITAELDRQATGFIFSDNLFLGAMKGMKKNLLLNIQLGVRHISNANLKLPNRGVNTINFRLGLSKLK